MMFLTLEDEFGLFEVTAFPDALGKLGRMDKYGPYVVSGRAQRQHDAVTVTAREVSLYRPHRPSPRPREGIGQ